jgi:tetratricopeptide (TPR) repeat protein
VALAFWLFKRRSILSFSILFFIITSSIISNIAFPIGTNMSERFMFMPSIGFCLAIAFLLQFINNQAIRTSLLVAVVLGFSIKTISRNPVWKDNETLFLTDVKTSTNSAKLQMAAGGSLVDKGVKETDPTKKTAIMSQALPHLEQALKLHPTYRIAYQYKGNCYFHLNEFEKAVETYTEGLKYYPDDRDLTNNVGMAYGQAGKYYGETKHDLPTAIKYLEKGYRILPNNPENARLLGIAYGMSQRHNEAVPMFERVTQLQPSAEAFTNLSMAYRYAGMNEKSAEAAQKAQNLMKK